MDTVFPPRRIKPDQISESATLTEGVTRQVSEDEDRSGRLPRQAILSTLELN